MILLAFKFKLNNKNEEKLCLIGLTLELLLILAVVKFSGTIQTFGEVW
jgi:hypothetical protein